MIVPIVCWGPHVRLAKQCIASLGDADYRIYTNVPHEFPGFETRTLPEGSNKHQRTTGAYMEALKEGPICTISPDMIASKGLIDALKGHLDKSLVMLPVVRVNSSITIPIFNIWPKVTPRELAGIAINYQHPLQLLQHIDKIPSLSNPTNVFQRKANTLAVRCFHMHPIFLNPDELRKVSAPIDDFMVTKFPKEKIYIVTDSDEMMVVDQTPLDYNWNGTRLTEPVNTAEFINRKCNPTHRWFFEHECFIHSGKIEKPDHDPRMDELLKLSRETPQRWTV